MSFQRESDSYAAEVDAVAEDLLRRGVAGPWEAINRAHEIVQRRRRARQRGEGGQK